MIYFTKHAEEKFDILKRHSIMVSRQDVIKTLENPELIDNSRSPLKIAQSYFDNRRVLRVVYREENGDKIVITFYPGRRTQYEKR